MNIVNLIGRIGQPIEIKFTGSGKKVTNFSLAVRESADTTYWFRCSAFDKTAEHLQQYVVKGDQVGITGKLTSRKYTPQDGKEITAVEIIVNHVTLLGSSVKPTETADRYDPNRQTHLKRNAAPEPEEPFTPEELAGLDIHSDDLPF